MRTMRKIAALAVTMVLVINQFVGVTSADELNLPEQEELMLLHYIKQNIIMS